MINRTEIFRKVYIMAIFFLLLLILATPHLANRYVFTFLDDEIAETLLMLMLMLIIIGFVIFRSYQKELEKNQKDLDNLINYIGTVNIQIQQMKSCFADTKKYPENKSDLKYIFNVLADKFLAMINAEWVIFRIVDIDKAGTLSEYSQTRGAAILPKHEMGNGDLIGGKVNDVLSVVKSNQDNFNIQAFCIFPKMKLNENQKIVAERIADDLAMIYLIFSSTYYKNTHSLK